MDAIEIARQKAASLHAQTVAAGHSPWSPLEFALAAASACRFDAEECEVGAHVLQGARATLVADESLIVYEKTESAFDRAFLIAHELGHAQLGDALPPDAANPPANIDPARSAEPPREGADRVVDYGRLQRREVQMDLYARELLLPRPWLRRLRLDEEMKAEAIAAKLGAPFDVVAQQLLDALLLPECEPQARPEVQPKFPLNDEQEAASAHRGAPFLLEAGPGTGKTATLVARVRSLLQDGTDPRRILVLTFSNKAAGEIIERIASVDRAAAAAMWVGTFHAFGLDLARRFSQAFGLHDDPRMLDRVDAVELLEAEFARLPLKHYRDTYDPSAVIMDILDGISRAKDEVVDAARYEELANAMLADPDPLAREKAQEVALVYRLYEDIKRERNALDFGDLVMRPVQVLESNDDVRSQLQSTYDHVLVDEYQDVNRSSVRLISALTGRGAQLWAVGDARQSIYRFRGASSFNMQRFGSQDFPGAKKNHLRVNYRSYQEILDAAGAFAAQMAVGSTTEALTAFRKNSQHPPRLGKVGLQEDQAVAMADRIEALKVEGYTYRDHAILCTGNEKVAEFAGSLERLGVPVLYLGNIFDRTDVKDLLAVVSLLVDKRASGLLRTGCMPEFAMPLEDVVAVMGYARAHDDSPDSWRECPSDIEGLTEGGRAALARLIHALDGFGRDAQPWQVLARVLLDRTDIADGIARAQTVKERGRGIAVWVLLNFLRSWTVGVGLPIRRVLDRIRRLVRLFSDRDLRQLPSAAQSLDAVTLMTVHSSKGLEFPVVHFPGINNGAMPHTGKAPRCLPPSGMIEGAAGTAEEAFRADQAAEQECLFYVALTRAQDRLHLYAATHDRRNYARALSPFVTRLGRGLIVEEARLSRALPPEAIDAPVPIAIKGAIRLKAAVLGLLGKCRRRVLYTNLLEIGGKRPPTSFLTMHDAVRDVVAAIVADDVRGEAEQIALLETAFNASGLKEHGYADDYLAIARGMIQTLHASRAGMSAEKPTLLEAAWGADRIEAVAEDVLIGPGGKKTFRRISTGGTRDPKGDLGAMAFSSVVTANHPEAAVEFLFLADGATVPAPFTGRQLANGKGKIEEHLRMVRDGDFAPERSAYNCPGCPAFFVCGPLPAGTLKKDFGALPV